MPYLETYTAYCVCDNGERFEWRGLRKAQAKWRFHWIKRNWPSLNHNWKEIGWQRDWQA